jgi:hypothetical protein
MAKPEKNAVKEPNPSETPAPAETPSPDETPATKGPSAAMLKLFSRGSGGSVKMKRKTLPTLLKGTDIPVGANFTGLIVDVVPSPVDDIDGGLLWLRHETGVERTFPISGVVREALTSVKLVKGKDEAGSAYAKRVIEDIKANNIGRLISLTREDDGISKRFNKSMRMFTVEVSEDLLPVGSYKLLDTPTQSA